MSVTEIAACLAEALITVKFCNGFLGFRTKERLFFKSMSFFALLALHSIFFTFQAEYQYSSIILLLVMIFVYCCLFLKGTVFEKILTAFLVVMSSMYIGLIIVNAFSPMTNADGERLFVLFFSKFGFFLVCELLVKFKKKSFSLTPFQWTLQIACYAVSFLATEILWKLSNGDTANKKAYLSVFVMLAFLNIFLYLMLMVIQKGAEERTEKLALKSELNSRTALVSEAEKKYTEIKILRHDMKHYLSSISRLLSNNEIQKAREYIDEIIREKVMPIGETEYIGISVIDAVLFEKRAVCAENGIELKTQIDTAFGSISELDISIIIANLLDNAVKGCAKVPDPQIDFIIKRVKAYLKIEVTNTVEHSVLANNPSLETSQKDKENHGFGIKSVKNVAEKYRGRVMFSESDKAFTSVVILKTNCQP